MIFDRTEEDVAAAKRLREEKVKTFQPLTDEEKETMERGFFTLSTANRIEEKQAELTALLNSMGYYNIGTVEYSHSWSVSDIFMHEDLQRFYNKAVALREGFFKTSDFPQNMKFGSSYKDINDIEKTLSLVEDISLDVKSRYKRCGAVSAGG